MKRWCKRPPAGIAISPARQPPCGARSSRREADRFSGNGPSPYHLRVDRLSCRVTGSPDRCPSRRVSRQTKCGLQANLDLRRTDKARRINAFGLCRLIETINQELVPQRSSILIFLRISLYNEVCHKLSIRLGIAT